MTTIQERDALATSPAREVALSCIEAGIEAAHPDRVIEETVSIENGRLGVGETSYDLYPYRRIVILGGGNAAAHVAAALESILGERLDEGIVVTDDPVTLETVTALPADHPIPSERGVESTRELLDLASTVDEDTLVLGVITGGGSALMAAPAAGITLDDLRKTTNDLLRSGASIHEINAVRKHCSAIKGGRLADALAPATVVTLILSDVVGNDLDVIASGPLVPDHATYEDALAVVDEYDLTIPRAVREHLEAGAAGNRSETPKPGDPMFDRVNTHVIADGFTALETAAETAAERGFDPVILSSRIEGEARDVGANHAAIADEMRATGNPVEPPAALLSGGETTVSVTGVGRGGPNQEFVLSGAIATDTDAVIAAADTDGIDGNADAAGAILDTGPFDDESAAEAALEEHDVTPFLGARNALIRTGQTGTNVNDLRVIVVPV